MQSPDFGLMVRENHATLAMPPDAKSIAEADKLAPSEPPPGRKLDDLAEAGSRWPANAHVHYEDVLWSPHDPDLLAVVLGEERPMDLNHGVEVSTEWEGRSLAQMVSRIAIINTATREVLAETSASLDVAGYGGALSWSPDGTQLAFSARRAEDPVVGDEWTDIFLLDVKSGESRALIARDGRDLDPRWSADGRAIAFMTDGGVRAWHRGLRIGIYDLKTQQTRLVPQSDETTRSSYGLSWYDKDTVMFIGMRRMTCPLFVASARADHIWQVTPDDLTCMGAGAPGPGGSILSVSHSFAHPGVLIQSARTRWAPVPIGPPLAGTLPAADIQTLSWKSSDGRFTVPGLLITPRDNRAGRRPLLVSIAGGPSMVEADVFNANAQQLIYPALLRGFAILVPNTRGRGGYGEAFSRAIADNKDDTPGPFTDVMTGVDLLVNDLRVADPDRMAVMGFSYGGGLSSYIASHTHRFKAIVAGEGAVELLSFADQDYGSIRQLGYQALFGVSNPYDPVERAIMMEESPITHAADVRTPLLIECGVLSLAGTECVKFFRAVRLTGTPTTLAVYPRSGHGLFEPALRYDSAVRETAWIDRWVLGDEQRR